MANIIENQEVSEKILPTIRNLDLNEQATFSLSRYGSVTATIARVRMEHDKKFRFRTDQLNRVMIVTRIA